jgi:SAM-dependent methyltransferase
MASIRKKLKVNENDSKNTRMDIANAGVLGNWRPDELTHISRYDKIASLCITEAKLLERPIDTFEVGCGELWVLRNIYKAYTVKKSEVIRSYYGVDIDPAVLIENPFWSNGGGPIEESTWLKNFNATLKVQDVTTHPTFDLEDESVDFFWTTEVIEHMQPKFVPFWLEDAARCLRPEGRAYVSTPNHEGSNDKLPKDHIYEWGFQELKEELQKHFVIESVVGTFIQMPNFKKVQEAYNPYLSSASRQFPQTWTPEQVLLLHERFGKQFLRMVLATPYPEVSNNCAWSLRKK